MDPFLTVYKKDYVRKPLRRTLPFSEKSEFKDPLNEAFRTFLHISDDESKSQWKYPEEDANAYLEKLKKCYSHLANSYKNPIDKSALERNFLSEGRSVYQVDYCNLEKDAKAKKGKESRKFLLPDDWDVPVTTQRWSYRNPTMLNTAASKPSLPVRPSNNLVPDENLRKILDVSTGGTEYQAQIGELGNIVIQDALHGKIIHLKCKHHRRR